MQPRQRELGLITTTTHDGLVVYDETTTELHSIPGPIAAIWRACDGDRDMTAIAIATGSTREEVQSAVEQLRATGLLEGESVPVVSTTSRRALAKKAALGAAIVSVTAPMAAQAVSDCAYPPDPKVMLTSRASTDPNYSLFTISVSGFCPFITYAAILIATGDVVFWGGAITTDANGNGVVSPPTTYACRYTFEANMAGVLSGYTRGTCGV